MRTITLPWETWRAIIAVLREKGLPSMREHADYLEWHLEQHGPDEVTVRLVLTDDVFLRSSNWARWQLGIPLPKEPWLFSLRPACSVSHGRDRDRAASAPLLLRGVGEHRRRWHFPAP